MSNLNPQIQVTDIGVKKLRQVTIYPLSMADQFKLSKIISEAIKEYTNPKDEKPLEGENEPSDDENKSPLPQTEIEMFRAIMSLIEENLIEILTLITDKDTIELNDLTNTQFAELCTIVYEVNFDNAMGKLQSLFLKVKGSMKVPNLSAQKRQQQKSSLKPTTNLNTSSDSLSKTEE